jgi:acetyltransferase-like isoleucine patch superfamily enzyme
MNKFSKILNTNVNLVVEDNVRIGENVVLGPNCKNIKISYGVILGRDIYIDVEDLYIGEYTTIHHGSIIHGLKTFIGHNCWFGHYTIIDSLGGDTKIGNNVGVGAHSQLWSHIKFGDTLNGCRWNSSGKLHLDDDVWLVGHSIVGPLHAESKSMLMTGSVAVKNMKQNRMYAGTPAIDITDKMGPQFEEVSLEEKYFRFKGLRNEFCVKENIPENIFTEITFEKPTEFTQTLFSVKDRTYYPIRSENEYKFIKFMLYDKAKWVPIND